jgi:outer membrane protein OmpA-like peptidoglycan-associated protein
MSETTKVSVQKSETKKDKINSLTNRKEESKAVNSPVDKVLHLQSNIGNQAVQKLFESGTLQAKSEIGKSNDKYEQEANRIADIVMRMPVPKESRIVNHKLPDKKENKNIQLKQIAEQITPLIQRQEEPEEEEEEPVQTKPIAEGITPEIQKQEEEPEEEEEEEEPVRTKSNGISTTKVTPNIESSINSLRGGGQPLPKEVRNYFEPRFGYDFSGVRVHTDSKAAETAKAINAKAYTKEKNIVFGYGQYSPDTANGKRLLAHELTHVIQQSASPILQKLDNSVIQRQADLTKAPAGLPCILKTGLGHTPGVDILFSVGKGTISSTDKTKLAAFATTWIASGSRDTVFVDGYASTDGAQSTNWRLSCTRAKAVKDELVRWGVSSSKIILIAHGESTEFSTSVQKENRRVVVSSLAEPTPSAIPPAVPPQPAPLSLKNIKFTSDHDMLKDNNTDWSNTGTVIEPEWITNPLRNKAISQTKNTSLVADITVNVAPPGTSFDLIGTGINNNDTSFKKTGITSTGTDQVITITADANLPDAVSKLFRYIVWKIKTGGKEQLAGFSGPHRIYVTYGTPSGGVTEKRMAWSCEKANTKKTPEKIADKIQEGVRANTTFGGGGTDGWNLLAGGSGDCDNLARLMSFAVKILGVTPATVKCVRASTNSGAGNCLDLETTWGFFSGTRYLIMYYYNASPGYRWNAYEGTCNTAGKYYAIEPFIKATDDYDMLKKIACTQHWVKSPVPPGAHGWHATNPSSAVPKP